MALTTCRECGAEVSPQAFTCPRCGAPRPADATWTGTGFEWQSEATYLGYPLIHVAFGKDARGRRRVAKGLIAVGQFAVGLITVAQFGIGVLFGCGQFILGCTALAQVAIAALAGVGQIATGYVAVGQVVLAYYGLAQIGLAKFLWSTQKRDLEAVQFFQSLWAALKPFLPR